MLPDKYGPFETNPELPQWLLDEFVQDDPTYQGVKVLLSAGDRFRLWYVARKMLRLLPVPKVFVDIGTWQGGSALLMYYAMGRTFEGSFKGYTFDPTPQGPVFYQVYPRMNDRVLHIGKHSHDAAAWLQNERGVKHLDLVFVDGGHSYNCVKQDILDYYPMLRQGGIILFHDWVPHNDNLGKPVSAGVRIACKEVLEDTYHCKPLEIPLLSETWEKPPGMGIPDIPSIIRGYRKP